MKTLEKYRVEPGESLDLAKIPSADDGGLKKSDGEEQFETAHARLIELENILAADGRYAILAVFQGMDTSGKDSTIRNVFSGLNPASVYATSFKAPNETERRHDFLWRVHEAVPPRGRIGIFNRSHYEDVLIVRVKQLVEEKRWKARYEHINAFERLLTDEGIIIRKFFLHISKDYQKERLEKRLENPEKYWKFDPADLAERARWDDYQAAYADAVRKCSTHEAPWYVIPAEKRWYRDLLVTRVLVQTLEGLDLRYPKPTFDPAAIHVQ